MQHHLDEGFNPDKAVHTDPQLRRFVERLTKSVERDEIVQRTTNSLREQLQVDRVVLYYFYRPWKGQVTFESLSSEATSLFGSTGPDECFNGEYAALYMAGRVRAVADIEVEPIQPCHREFLRSLQVRANLVVPVLTVQGLWGLLIAHQCRSPHDWSIADIEAMQEGARTLAEATPIRKLHP